MFILNILVVLLCTTGIQGAKKIYCDFDDAKCTTQSAMKTNYYDIAAKEGLWESSDPLKPHLAEGHTSDLSIRTYNGALTGLLQCDLLYLTMNTTVQTMDYAYYCPRLTEEGDFLVNGYIGDEYVNGRGPCQIHRDQYKIIFNTKYVTYFKNGQQYIHATDYDVRFECEGKASYYCDTRVYNGDKKKADRVLGYMNRNWKTMEKTIGNQMMRSYMRKFMKNMDDECKVIPLREFFFYEV